MAERDYMAARLFTDRDSAEREYEAARARGYDPKDINVVMTEEGRKRHFGHGVATELGNMKVSSEILALTSLGIDPPRFIVLPRLVASVVSVLVLMVYFAATALAGTALMAVAIANIGLGAFQSALSGALTLYDLGLFVVKGVGLGAIVGWLSCHYGLEVKSSPTEVPQMASRAVVRSLLGCVAYNTLATALFYWTVGQSIR